MSAFRNKGRKAVKLALVLIWSGALWVTPGIPAAQSPAEAPGDTTEEPDEASAAENRQPARPGNPVTLLPGFEIDAEGRFVRTQSGAPPPAAAEPAAAPRNGEAGPQAASSTADGGDTVAVESLEQIDPESVGLLSAENGGFGADMWQGTPRELIVRTMAMVPVSSHSPVVRDLARRLLLSTADIPKGGDPESKEILQLRVERLLAAGYVVEVLEIMARAGVRPEDTALNRIRLRAQMVGGDYAGGCRNARQAVQRESERFWIKTAAFCKALDGDLRAARLSLDLLAEQGDMDPVYRALMNRFIAIQSGTDMSGEGLLIDDLAALDPLYMSMMRALRVDIPVGALDSADPLLLKAIATSPSVSVDVRLEAANLAARAGAIDIAALRQIYGAPAFTSDELTNTLNYPLEEMGARAQALLYQAALGEPSPRRRAQLIRRALEIARGRDMWPVIAMVNQPATASLPPAENLVWFAPDAARVLILGRHIRRAREWYDQARRMAAVNDLDAAAAVVDIWPLLLLGAGPSGLPTSEAAFDIWWQSKQPLPAETRVRHGQTLYALLEAFNQPVPARMWTNLIEAGDSPELSAPRLAAWRGMVNAANMGRTGETVLLALVALQDELDSTSVTVIASAVSALRAIGLHEEARALAGETALQRGL